MEPLETAKAVSDAYFDELRATVEIRQAYYDIIVLNSATLFAAFGHDARLKNRLKDALKLKTTDQSALLRGLFVQAVGVFDEFIRSLISAKIEERSKACDNYNDLSEKLRNGFISNSGKVLTHYGRGTVNGVRYDFSRLTKSLVACLSESKDYYLEPRVFTILTGNITPDRLRNLFDAVDLPDPFSPELGECTELKKALGETRKGQVAQLAEKRLSGLIDLRNDIAHGDLTATMSADEFLENISVLSALTTALKELCQN